jgi:hypothetical protein
VSKCTFVTDNGCRCRSANLPFYQAKLLLCRFVTTKFSPLVEFAGISNAVVTRADCILFKKYFTHKEIVPLLITGCNI